MARTKSGTEVAEYDVLDRTTWEQIVQDSDGEPIVGTFDYEETGEEQIYISPDRKVQVNLVGKLVDGRVATDVVVSTYDENVLTRSEVEDLIAVLTRSLRFFGPEDE